jgi:ligand-binding sensor domain-containing protein
MLFRGDNHWSKTLYLCLILLVNGLFMSAQNRHVTYYSVENGLPSNKVRHALFDSLGFLWVTTDNGIVRFDGTTFQNYSQFVPSRYGRNFCQIKEGILLSHDAGISLIKPGLVDVDITLYQEGAIESDGPALYYPDQLFRQQNGHIWIGQPGGRINRLANSKMTTFYLPESTQLQKDSKIFFCEGNNQRLWLAHSEGTLFSLDQEELVPHELPQISLINDIQSRGKDIWMAGEHVYRIQLTEDGKGISRQEVFYSELGDVTSLAIDDQGVVFVGIKSKGLYFLDFKEGGGADFIKVYGNNDPHQIDELPFKHINYIFAAPNDQLWICSNEGLGVLQKRFFESIGSIPNANATAIAIADNGKVFANFGDVYVLEKDDFGFHGSRLSTADLGTVTALTTAGNFLWVATSTGMLYQLNANGVRLKTIDLRERGEGIFALSYDSSNRLWVSQAPEEKPVVGIGCIEPDGTLKEYGLDKGLATRIIGVRESSNGQIYATGIGKTTYLYRYLAEEDTFINLSLPFDFYVNPNFQIHDLTIDDQGIVWLATTDGLLKYNADRITKVDLGEEFSDTEVRAVIHTDNGSIWVAFDTEGVLYYRDGVTVSIREESGLPSEIMTYRCLVKDQFSRLWAGTAEGIVYSALENPQPRKSSEPLWVSSNMDGEVLKADEIQIFPQQELEIEYIAPAFHGYRTFYQHRIEEGEWSVPSTSPIVSFKTKDKGKYSIETRVKKEGAYLWSNAVKAEVAVLDHWYKNQFLIWGLGLALGVGILTAVFSRRKKYKQSIQSLRQGLQDEKAALDSKDADLAALRNQLLMERKQHRANLLSLEIIHRIISKITPDMKWDTVLEIISLDLMKLPGVVAFEIGIQQGDQIEFEGYTESQNAFTSYHTVFDPGKSLAAYCMFHARPEIFNRLEEQSNALLAAQDKRVKGYKSGIFVPFYIQNRNAVFVIYSDVENLFDNYALKAITVFTTYLEQIY